MRGSNRTGASPRFSRRRFLIASSSLFLAGCVRSANEASESLYSWGGQGLRDGEFIRPRAIGTFHGRVYVIDTTGRIQVFTPEGVFIHQWRMPEHENGTPTAIAFTDDGRVLVPDTHYSRIVEFTTEGEVVRAWGDYGNGPGQFIYPTGIVESPHGLFYISEYGENAERVQVYDQERNFVRAWGRHGTEPAEFNRAMAITMNSAHVVFVADTTNHRVQCFDPKGNLLRVIGGLGTGPGQLKFPHDLSLAPDGSLLVCEYGTNRISRFGDDGTYLGSFGGPGRGLGRFHAPRGVAVDETGDVFVADTENHRIQRFSVEALV